jgi:NAD+ synthase (glutamine-hydrolysing)
MVRIALAQVNPTVGDIEGNCLVVGEWVARAREAGADLVAFPELVITGYPPEDLVLKPSFVRENLEAVESLAMGMDGIAAVVGFIHRDGESVYNAAALIAGGRVVGVYHKKCLPNYGVFDEERYFRRGDGTLLVNVAGALVGVTICEDLWTDSGAVRACVAAGASLVININGSPFHRGKGGERLELLRRRAREAGAAIAYVNMVGGQDELVFDGQSLVVGADGEVLARAKQFEEELLVFDFEPPDEGSVLESRAGGDGALRIVDAGVAPGSRPNITTEVAAEMDPVGEVYSALVLGVRDYLRKNGFDEALVGISGGVDSALTAAIAVDAMGAGNVLGVSNPSEFTSAQSIRDAETLASNLGIKLVVLPIDEARDAAQRALGPVFAGMEWGVAEENLQSRLRGLLWMAISNKSEQTAHRRIVLSTGNKSEMATGYATLYGDMAGGFAVLKDVPKTLVYELARWRNREGEVIPMSILERAPSAELRPGQLDTDSLPTYEKLDPILEAYVEEHRSVEEMIEAGFDAGVVRRVVALVDRAEYKRRQAPPGVKITKRAFGRDWRLPITNRFRPGK